MRWKHVNKIKKYFIYWHLLACLSPRSFWISKSIGSCSTVFCRSKILWLLIVPICNKKKIIDSIVNMHWWFWDFYIGLIVYWVINFGNKLDFFVCEIIKNIKKELKMLIFHVNLNKRHKNYWALSRNRFHFNLR